MGDRRLTSHVFPLDNIEREDALTNKYAWIVSSTWAALHYVNGFNADTWYNWWDHNNHTATTACGRTFEVDLPGIFSRMGLHRCVQCCRKLRIPDGDGAPANNKTLNPTTNAGGIWNQS